MLTAVSTQCDALVVEDDQVQCEEMARFLARAGIAVATAFNGTSALQRAALTRPRVALLDYNLPDMTGVELAARLRALLPHAALLMMSGRIDGLPEQTIQAIGLTVFVNKPMPPMALRQAVLKLLKSGSAPAPGPQRTSWLSAGVGGTR